MTERVWPHHRLGREISNWGRWGPQDEIGTLNLITARKRVEAAALVRTGSTFDLGMAFDKDGPHEAGGFRVNPQHLMTVLPSDTRALGLPDGLISADDMIIMPLQAATQWDGLAHVGYDGVFYNGVPETAVGNAAGAVRNSFATAATRLISRGVLLDIADLHGLDRLGDSYEITVADLEAAERRQDVLVGSGDVLCLRTGHHQWFLEGDRTRYMAAEPGLGIETSRWLRDRDVAALAVDNWACEVWPATVPDAMIPFHQIAIRDLGLTLGEMFDFEHLAADCRADGVWEFLFSGIGLKVTGAVGSPVTPIAVK